MRRFRWDKKYLYWGATAFAVIAAGILFFMLVNNLGWLRDALRQIGGILSPFVWGLAIAYLLYPLMQWYSRCLFAPLWQILFRKHTGPFRDRRIHRLSRGFAVSLCVLTLFVVIGGLIWLVVPQLYSSVERIVTGSSDYIDRADAWLTRILSNYPELDATISGAFGDLSNGIVTWATNDLLPDMRSLITNVTVNVYYVVRDIYNVLIGIIVSVYVLYSQELFAASGKKLLYSLVSLEAAEKILDGVAFANRTFQGFLTGKILDSIIVGILCFISCNILRMPYALLVSAIVGVTNIIPFFGPFIGAVPATVIILTESPLRALIFLVFIVILQQFDGNILGPKILGNRVGINGFWILFSIILGAGLFGFVGMLLGVPVFVLCYTFLNNLIDRKLRRNHLPVDAGEYVNIRYIDPKSRQAVSKSASSRNGEERGRRKETAPPASAAVSEEKPRV